MSYSAPLLPMRGGSAAPRTPARCAWRLPTRTAARAAEKNSRDKRGKRQATKSPAPPTVAMRRVYDKLVLSFVKREVYFWKPVRRKTGAYPLAEAPLARDLM